MNRLASLATLGFTNDPFSKAIGDNELWMAPSQEDIMLALIDAADNRECALLAGDPGVGKTCLLRAVRRQLPPSDYRLTYCHNATLGKRDFYRQLCLALGLSPSATAGALFYAVSSHVAQLFNAGIKRIHFRPRDRSACQPAASP